MLEFYSSYIRTARKPHKCEYCQKDIMIGEKYSYESGKFEGDFFTRTLYEALCTRFYIKYGCNPIDFME